MYDLVVVVAVLAGAWLGSLGGLGRAAAVGVEMFVGLALGVLFHEAIGGGIAWGLRLALEPVLSPDFPFQSLSVALAFLVLTWGTVAFLRFRFHPEQPVTLDTPEPTTLPPVERFGGAAAGAVAGFIGSGAVLVTLSMLPLPAALRPTPRAMFFDAGSVVLRAAGQFEADLHEGSSLVVHGEPAARPGQPGRAQTCEPWIDTDEDGQPSDADRWHDVDGNGTYTAGLAYLDLDGDGLRRIGLIDKYATGGWNGTFDIAAAPEMPAPDTTAAAPRPAGRPRQPEPGRGQSAKAAKPTEAPEDDF